MLKATKKLLKPAWYPLRASTRYNPYGVSFMNFLRNTPYANLEVTKLCNGLTIATEERDCCSACIGIYVDAGPRYESEFEHGITHFFEHIAFKATCARNRATLKDQMSCTGARYRTFTRRDMTGYYAACLSQDVMITVDLLSDCVFNNAFNPADIEQQKNVVYNEMLKHDQDANELLYDYLHATAFQGTPMARSVMGPSCNLYNFNSNTILLYMNKFYDGCRTFLVGVGGVKHKQLVALGNTYLGKLEPTKCRDKNIYRYTGSEIRYRNDAMPVANVAIAVEGPSLCHEDHVVMEVAAELVGGWDRSQPGGIDHAWFIAQATSSVPFCDAYKSFLISYRDTSLWGVQFIGPSLALDDMATLVLDEWKHLCNTVTEVEVQRARRVLKTKVLSMTESMTRTCHDIGKWLMYQGSRETLDERLCAIDRVYANDIRSVVFKYVYEKCPVVAGIGPTEGLSDYTRIRAGMYTLKL